MSDLLIQDRLLLLSFHAGYFTTQACHNEANRILFVKNNLTQLYVLGLLEPLFHFLQQISEEHLIIGQSLHV